ncbi:MAG: shikimate 5-dehydrogenase [Verrucomicrobiaceae bacterium]|nr:shikimate 5-dehydrogenase [Verrucomicrobiaceae bacterium]
MSLPNSFCHQLVGSISQGAAGNPTVAMVEAAFQRHGLNWRYVNMEVAPEDLAAAVQGAWAMGFRGFNLSMPHKVTVIPMLGSLGESAALIGAVNCVVRRDGQFIGENTDGKGFLTSLQGVIDPKGKQVVMFGAGGAARAVAVELALVGTRKIIIVNRDPARGQELVDTLRDKTRVEAELVPWQGDYAIPEGTDVVINGTSIGLYEPEARLALDLDTLKPGMVVADVVFNPPRTRLLVDAEDRGCIVVDGLGMLVNQGVIGVQHWTGIDPDAAAMRRALELAMGV